MKRLIGVLVVLLLFGAACGGDDDDDADASAADDGGSSEDFCGLLDELSALSATVQGESDDQPTKEDLRQAKALVAHVREQAPDDLRESIEPLLDLVDEGVDTLESGGDPSEIGDDADFEDVFGKVLTAATALQEYEVETCGKDPSAVGLGPSGEASFSVGDVLGIPEAEVVEILTLAFPGFQGASQYSGGGDEYSFDIAIDGTVDDALEACRLVAEKLSSHDGASGTLDLTIREAVDLGADDPFGGEVLVENDGIAAGDDGACVAAA